MTLGLDGNTDRLNTAFCITIEENHLDSSIVLTLTCEDNVSRSSTAISTSPTVITSRNMVHHKNTSQPLTRRETRTSLAKTETANTVEASAGNINVTNGPKANNTHTLTTITTNDPGESRFHTQKDEIVVGAAVGGSCGGVVLVIVIIVIIFICYKRRIKNKYRQSKEPASVYTELEFGSRDGQNDNPVYSAIEPQQIYINIVH
ncbi:hypothetical protein ACJMK2_024247 [Sinanodonta woodiana]|uniref:Mid2 domain-containing protein n=1 Tax=Sinanodonta woodiana TaxID=1069815 RepID=A0ABD3T735_SINWO